MTFLTSACGGDRWFTPSAFQPTSTCDLGLMILSMAASSSVERLAERRLEQAVRGGRR